MMKARFALPVLPAILCLAAGAFGSRLSLQEHAAMQESLGRMPAKFHAQWLQRHGLDASRYTEYHRPETTRLVLKGKWGRGTSNEVTGRGNLVALTLGSEVALLNVANPDSPVVLSEIQLSFIPAQSALHDSFLLTGGNGIEIWNIADSTDPGFRAVIPYAISDFAVFDTLLYFSSGGTFYAYSIANASTPRQLGTCADRGDVASATRNVAVVRESSYVLGFIDVTNPAAPTRVGTYPSFALAADARNTICCAEIYWQEGSEDRFRFEVLDISNPANVVRIGAIDSVSGWDVHLSGPIAFASGYQYPEWEFTLVSIQDSAHPQVISSCATPGIRFGVWADWTSNRAYVADAIGMALVNIANLNSPVYDTTMLVAHVALDVWLDQGRAYVADDGAGLRILDATNPAMPVELGGIYAANYGYFDVYTAVGRDSFAFASWLPSPPLRSIDVSDPANPKMAGGLMGLTTPMDMVLRDTLLYLAGRLRLHVVNVARPREPELVGSCVTGELHQAGIWLDGDTAYVAGAYDGLYIVDVSDPRSPAVVKVLSGVDAWGCCVRDSFLFVSDFDESLHIFSVANLSNVYELGSVYVSEAGRDVGLLGNYAVVGAAGLGLVDISDPRGPRLLASYSTPDYVRRVVCDSLYVYAACQSGGVLILNTTSLAMTDRSQEATRPPGVRLLGSLTNMKATIEFSSTSGKEVRLLVFDMAGRMIGRADVPTIGSGMACYQLDLDGNPAGVYIVRASVGNGVYQLRITKLQ